MLLTTGAAWSVGGLPATQAVIGTRRPESKGGSPASQIARWIATGEQPQNDSSRKVERKMTPRTKALKAMFDPASLDLLPSGVLDLIEAHPEILIEALAAIPPNVECEKRIAIALHDQQTEALDLLRELADEPFLATPEITARARQILRRGDG
jgi:hypothetical protein